MEGRKTIVVAPEDAGVRLDVFLARQNSAISRARAQQVIRGGEVLVNGLAARGSLRLKAGDVVNAPQTMHAPPLRAVAEPIPLEILYEDDDLAVINKPAGMRVHAGAGATESARNRGTLVNALDRKSVV